MAIPGPPSLSAFKAVSINNNGHESQNFFGIRGHVLMLGNPAADAELATGLKDQFQRTLHLTVWSDLLVICPALAFRLSALAKMPGAGSPNIG